MTVRHVSSITAIVVVAIAASTGAQRAGQAEPRQQPPEDREQSRGPVLILDDLTSLPIELVQLDDETLVHAAGADGWRTVDLDRCVAMLDTSTRPRTFAEGMLELSDGQRLPGQAMSNPRPDEDALAWNHAWLGRLAVPLQSVRRLRLSPYAPAIEPGDADVVLLSNGDRLEGFVVALGDPISIEVAGETGPTVTDVPIERVVAVAMVTPARESEARRVWFDDGTVIDVSSLRIGDDGFVRLSSPWVGSGMLEHRLQVDEIAAVLFAPGVLRPLAALAPASIDGPSSRFMIPPPRSLDREPPLDLARLEYRGPIVVRYPLPAGTTRFAAEALLPPDARDWGDFELVVRDDDRVVFRGRLDRASPTASINVGLRGSELTIELTEGRFGPIQDRVVLHRPMLK